MKHDAGQTTRIRKPESRGISRGEFPPSTPPNDGTIPFFTPDDHDLGLQTVSLSAPPHHATSLPQQGILGGPGEDAMMLSENSCFFKWWVHPRKLTCPLKKDYFNGKYIFQPLIFRGYVSFPVSKWDYK